ncbi:hypothetical protein, partial [Escherichia coli]|uniref:hypothetical protein n=1 Tax=Escherichia coli TaxID=562 RepID=UPI0025749DFA
MFSVGDETHWLKYVQALKNHDDFLRKWQSELDGLASLMKVNAEKEKQKRAFLNINMAQVVDLQEEEWEVQPARLGVGFVTSKGLTQKLALIDIGASHNLMSYETWAALEMPALNPTNAQVKAVNSTIT